MTATGALSDERNSARDARDLLERYQRAMLAFDADALAGLYAPDAVHEFPFTTPGHAARYESADEVRAAYRRVWANRRVALGDLRNVAAHQSDDTIVSEWTARARLIDDPSSTFDLAGVLVITARDGRIAGCGTTWTSSVWLTRPVAFFSSRSTCPVKRRPLARREARSNSRTSV